MADEMEKQLREILERERWRGYVSGKMEGAINVLYALDLTKEKRLQLLSEAVGLSEVTATEILKPKEIEYRIYRREDLTQDQRFFLSSLMSNKTMDDDKAVDNPRSTIEMIAAVGNNKILEDVLPQVDIWVESGEEVSLRRVKDWLIEKYDLF